MAVSEVKRIRPFLIIAIIMLSALAIARAESDYTVIIVNQTTKDCRVLEGFNTELDVLIPSGWEKITLDQGMCFSVIPKLKKRDDFNVHLSSYVDILDCSKGTTVQSLSYFGRGAEEICSIAGYDFSDKRLIVSPKGTDQEMPEKNVPYLLFIAILFVISILTLLILIRKKKKHKKNR
ncbi:MAG: hypothetical protein ABIJ21_07680 [Nanoarchaeota archaeon]